jgi:pheromone shutdown protein TraB
MENNMTKIESADEFADRAVTHADDWDRLSPYALAPLIAERDRAVAKKVLEELAAWRRLFDDAALLDIANNPAELDRLLANKD